jgi:hypothetical protein
MSTWRFWSIWRAPSGDSPVTSSRVGAAARTVFLSSEMGELGDLRQTVSRALRDAGFSVVVLAAIRERLDLAGGFVDAWIERNLL